MTRILITLWVAASLGEPAGPEAADRPVDFSREVRPILANYCIRCHGPDDKARKGGLRLDNFEGATE